MSFSTEDCIFFNLYREMRIATAIFNKSIKSLDLIATQFVLLLYISQSEDSVTSNKILEDTMLERTGMQRNLKTLEKRGWLSIKRVKTLYKSKGRDRSTVFNYYSLTESGKEIVKQGISWWKGTQEAYFNRKTIIDLFQQAAQMRDS